MADHYPLGYFASLISNNDQRSKDLTVWSNGQHQFRDDWLGNVLVVSRRYHCLFVCCTCVGLGAPNEAPYFLPPLFFLQIAYDNMLMAQVHGYTGYDDWYGAAPFFPIIDVASIFSRCAFEETLPCQRIHLVL